MSHCIFHGPNVIFYGPTVFPNVLLYSPMPTVFPTVQLYFPRSNCISRGLTVFSHGPNLFPTVLLPSFGYEGEAQETGHDAVSCADRPAHEGGQQRPDGATQHHRQAA